MVIKLEKGWGVMQDIHNLGEYHEIYRRDFDPTWFGGFKMNEMTPWQPIDRLEHLQLSLADNPYYGFALRQFNAAPWWYRNIFDMPECGEYATITFKGVDYFADVWLNEVYLGRHEGYQNPFTFEVGGILKEKDNLLIVKVSAPLDENDTIPGGEDIRFLHVLRQQMKGTYEHNDTFIPRDCNPVGIWNDVVIEVYDGVRLEEYPSVPYELEEDYKKATIHPTYDIYSHFDTEAEYEITVKLEGDIRIVAKSAGRISLKKGSNTYSEELVIENPKLWTVWERGRAYRYSVTMKLVKDGKRLLENTRYFGVRKLELYRDEKEMYVRLNGEKLYVRGATYFPDVYVSANNRELYRRDIANAKLCGLNAWRIHVHTELDELYDMCDQAGILLMQDSDFNFTHPYDEAWAKRAVKIFGETVKRLRDHPSIFCWVLLNEPRMQSYLTEYPGPQLMELVKKLDPDRPYILSSWSADDPDSGDSHNYEGSLHGNHTHYTNIHDGKEKFNTEFGMDAVPTFSTLRKEPELVRILDDVVDGIDTIQYYQYRYIKYFIEHYRLQKFAPCGGHFQFLFSDVAPTSHFGLYDRCGLPKEGQRACEESNQPLAVMMDATRDEPLGIWVVNDLLNDLGNVTVECLVWDEKETIIVDQKTPVFIDGNSRVFVSPLQFAVDAKKEYTVRLRILNEAEEILAENVYEKAFNHPEHVLGHPQRVHYGLALRLYWAWMNDKRYV